MTSDRVFAILLAQTWQVGLLAAGIWTLTRIAGRDRPHLAHCLWTLVILKCLMPPVWTSPVGLFCWINTLSLQWIAKSTAISPALWVEPTTQSDVAIRISGTSGVSASPSDTLRPIHAVALDSPQLTPKITQVKHLLLMVWCLGCVVSAGVAIGRLVMFWRFVYRSSLPRTQVIQSLTLEQLVHRLSRQLQLNRRVSVSVLDAAVGPAVYGLVRPIILLPRAIVREQSLAELEPLLAHELIHVRRGDLWWALVQTLACCLFWFHPLVWLAQAMLVREAERSCDEETVASLKCSPVEYARSLLRVLECKQRLRVAPALPGVRPVDITRNRLERIMRLGQGSHASTPVWVWLLFLGSLTILLPGGAWLSAQEGRTSASRPSYTTEKRDKGPTMAPPAKGAWVESWQNEQIEVGDLLDKLELQHGDREVARGVLLSMIPQRSINAINAEGNVTLSSVPPFLIDGNTLKVFETRDQIANIKQEIAELSQLGFDHVRIQIELLTISKEQLNALGLNWEKAHEPTNGFLREAVSSVPTSQEIEAMHRLPTPHFMGSVPQEQPSGKVPAFAASGPVQPASASAASHQAVPVTVKEASPGRITLGGSIQSDLGIAGSLVIPTNTHVEPEETYFAILDAEKAAAISRLASKLSAPKATCRNGSYVKMASYSPWSAKPRTVSFDRPAPIQPMPQLGFSGFSLAARPLILPNQRDNESIAFDLSLACLVREVTRLDRFTFAGGQTSVADGGSSSVQQPNVEWKTLAAQHTLEAGQSLLISSRKPLASESENKGLVVLASCEIQSANSILHHNGDTPNADARRPRPVKDRLPINGVLTSGDQVENLPEPSTDETLSAWQKAMPNDRFWASLNGTRIEISKVCIGDYADDKRFVPMIGDAILHHRIYNCNAYQFAPGESDANPTWIGSFVVDHHHFHMVDPKTPANSAAQSSR